MKYFPRNLITAEKHLKTAFRLKLNLQMKLIMNRNINSRTCCSLELIWCQNYCVPYTYTVYGFLLLYNEKLHGNLHKGQYTVHEI